ncbi:flagellar hook-associated protein 3 [Cryobacterium roopkundense]|uniref:Flagellar hook-associated protein 3 n=1 Tax=Cryobacterium roopkundense TaxID=1001240 RepID=A0A099JM99_9MICO|nr:flagellar hook-associated protein FlgL [Cryobacterium roopkundense]KGJ79509.1 flagellar hook-associated protein 3 [Cryobacterium roopkundense]MBB5640803.1 flagellar hook-associated protein 3 FlgL [Cryobacterium roopkundense]
MISRVTSQTQMRTAQQNLQENMANMSRLQEQASSLKAINRASDDPTAAAAALSVRAEARAVDQYSRNADNGNDWLTTLDSALGASTNIMNRVRDLTVQGGNGALSPAAKEAIAVELEGLKDDLLGLANTSYLGRTVFAGSSDAGAAFRSDYSFTGDTGSSVTRRIGADTTVRVDADGGAVFGSGANSVFSLIDTIASNLRDGTPVNDQLGDVDERLAVVIGQRSEVGARQARMERAQGTLLEQSGSLESQRSGLEDVDLAQVIVDLKLQEVTYQSALAVTARVLQPTLMDFLR